MPYTCVLWILGVRCAQMCDVQRCARVQGVGYKHTARDVGTFAHNVCCARELYEAVKAQCLPQPNVRCPRFASREVGAVQCARSNRHPVLNHPFRSLHIIKRTVHVQ
jgi:hypothetical protein